MTEEVIVKGTKLAAMPQKLESKHLRRQKYLMEGPTNQDLSDELHKKV